MSNRDQKSSNNYDTTDDPIYQLDELINDIYLPVYAPIHSKVDEFKIKFIDIADLKLSRFKLSDYNLDTIFEKTPIQFVGLFPTGMIDNGKEIEQIWFKRKGETHTSTIRIVPYKNKDVINDMKDPVNVNQIIRTLLSELVVNERTKNCLLPIVNIDVKGSDLVAYEKVKSLIVPDRYYSIQITEKFYRLMTLDNFMKEYPIDSKIFKTIIYQAVDVLYQISISYPDFRYNQMIPSMIDCYLKTDNDTIYPEIKLGDFYLSEIKDVATNNILKSSVNVPQIDSIYGDLYQLLNYLWNHNYADIKKYPDIMTIFDTFLPSKIRSKDIYLSADLWDRLSDEEKFELKIKNIRNSSLFTSKDSLMGTKFVDQGDFSSDLTGGESEIFDDETNSNDDTPIGIINEHTQIKRINEISSSNKKYSNNDIGIMNHKKSVDKSSDFDNLEVTPVDNDYHVINSRDENSDETMERTEETYQPKPSRIINVSEKSNTYKKSNKGSRKNYVSSSDVPIGKLKTYRGQRRIINEGMIYNKPISDHSNTYQNSVPENNMFMNGVQSKINSIGSALGVTPNDFANYNPNANYSQIAQQMSQQYQGQGMENTINPNVSMPMPNYNPMQNIQSQHQYPFQTSQTQQMYQAPQMPGQSSVPMQQQQADVDAYYRFLAATQGQTDNNVQSVPMYMQQTSQVPQMQYPPLSQSGGSKPNPFFFR